MTHTLFHWPLQVVDAVSDLAKALGDGACAVGSAVWTATHEACSWIGAGATAFAKRLHQHGTAMLQRLGELIDVLRTHKRAFLQELLLGARSGAMAGISAAVVFEAFPFPTGMITLDPLTLTTLACSGAVVGAVVRVISQGLQRVGKEREATEVLLEGTKWELVHNGKRHEFQCDYDGRMIHPWGDHDMRWEPRACSKARVYWNNDQFDVTIVGNRKDRMRIEQVGGPLVAEAHHCGYMSVHDMQLGHLEKFSE